MIGQLGLCLRYFPEKRRVDPPREAQVLNVRATRILGAYFLQPVLPGRGDSSCKEARGRRVLCTCDRPGHRGKQGGVRGGLRGLFPGERARPGAPGKLSTLACKFDDVLLMPHDGGRRRAAWLKAS